METYKKKQTQTEKSVYYDLSGGLVIPVQASQEVSSNLFRFSDCCHSSFVVVVYERTKKAPYLVKSFLDSCQKNSRAVSSFIAVVYEQKRKKKNSKKP